MSLDDKSVKDILSMVAPGMPLREAIDNIMRADKGALIFLVQDPKEYLKNGVIQGGFDLNCPFTPNKVYELAKMDGAIVLSEDLKKIWYANVQLSTDRNISTNETGTRHRTAERLALQTGKLVIAVSQRRKVITLYQKDWKYMVKDVSVIVLQMNQGIRLMERYRTNFDNSMASLSTKEMENRVTLFDVFEIINRGLKIISLYRDLSFYLSELGNEGALTKLHMDELNDGIDENIELLVMDYASERVIGKAHDPDRLMKALFSDQKAEKLDLFSFVRYMGYDIEEHQIFEMTLQPRGYRLLRSIPRIPMNIAHDLVKKFENISGLLKASFDDLMSVDGVAEKRATVIMSGISSLKNRTNYGN
jgi:diadenylate cyclase